MGFDASDTADRIVLAALGLAAEKGWHALSLDEIAIAADVPMASMRRYYPVKSDILTGFTRMVDEQALGGTVPSPDEAPRDRLFDLMMRRFDVLAEHRPGVQAILGDLRRDPCAALMQGRQIDLSMRWTLESAGISTDGPLGRIRSRALAVIYLLVLRVWRNDDTADMDRTMKALDARLRQAEEIETMFRGPGRRRNAPSGRPKGVEPANTAPPD
jgi:AcrR family transcriptional regulator